jgi:hypothetical protein
MTHRRGRRRTGFAAAAAALVLLLAAVVAANGGLDHGRSAASLAPGTLLAPLTSLERLGPPGPAGRAGPEGVPVPNAPPLAGGEPARAGSPVDGIQCQVAEQVLFHIHAHLTVFVNGAARQIPYGIGIPASQASSTPAGPFVGSGACFYWLHTHAADGIIHIESPIQRTFTLGNFFDLWGQKLSPTEVGPAIGRVTALYDGRWFRGDPRDIPLSKHAEIQLDVGRPLVAPVRIGFPSGL